MHSIFTFLTDCEQKFHIYISHRLWTKIGIVCVTGSGGCCLFIGSHQQGHDLAKRTDTLHACHQEIASCAHMMLRMRFAHGEDIVLTLSVLPLRVYLQVCRLVISLVFSRACTQIQNTIPLSLPKIFIENRRCGVWVMTAYRTRYQQKDGIQLYCWWFSGMRDRCNLLQNDKKKKKTKHGRCVRKIIMHACYICVFVLGVPDWRKGNKPCMNNREIVIRLPPW